MFNNLWLISDFLYKGYKKAFIKQSTSIIEAATRFRIVLMNIADRIYDANSWVGLKLPQENLRIHHRKKVNFQRFQYFAPNRPLKRVHDLILISFICFNAFRNFWGDEIFKSAYGYNIRNNNSKFEVIVWKPP